MPGLDVSSTSGLGYQLATALLDMNVTKLRCLYFPVIDSTNTYLLTQLPQLNSGHVCLAEAQTNGRGRRGRVWV